MITRTVYVDLYTVKTLEILCIAYIVYNENTKDYDPSDFNIYTVSLNPHTKRIFKKEKIKRYFEEIVIFPLEIYRNKIRDTFKIEIVKNDN